MHDHGADDHQVCGVVHTETVDGHLEAGVALGIGMYVAQVAGVTVRRIRPGMRLAFGIVVATRAPPFGAVAGTCFAVCDLGSHAIRPSVPAVNIATDIAAFVTCIVVYSRNKPANKSLQFGTSE